MFHDVCEFGMSNFIRSTPNAPFSLDSVAYGTGGMGGEVQLLSKTGIRVTILLSSMCKGSLAKQQNMQIQQRQVKLFKH